MTKQVARSRAVAKSAPSQNRNQKCRIRNLSASVMLKMKDVVKPRNVAHELNFLTDVPVPSVQKMMSGDRPVNLELIVGLLRGEHGREVLFTIMDGANPDWFSKYRKLLDNNDLHRKMVEIERAIAAKNRELAE